MNPKKVCDILGLNSSFVLSPRMNNSNSSHSSNNIPPILCEVCQNGTHHPSDCPELTEPMKDGFYSGGGGGAHDHDHDKDHSGYT